MNIKQLVNKTLYIKIHDLRYKFIDNFYHNFCHVMAVISSPVRLPPSTPEEEESPPVTGVYFQWWGEEQSSKFALSGGIKALQLLWLAVNKQVGSNLSEGQSLPVFLRWNEERNAEVEMFADLGSSRERLEAFERSELS